MRPVRIVRGDGAALALAGAADEGVLDVVVASRRHRPVKATRLPVDLEAVTASLPADPWRELLGACWALEDAVRGVLACDGADLEREDLVGAVRDRLTAMARAASEVV